MSETETPTMLTEAEIQEAAEAYRGLTQQRRMLERFDPILTVVMGALHYLTASKREAEKIVETATATAAAIITGAEEKAAAAERIAGTTKVEVARLRDEGVLVSADNDRLQGKNAELEAKNRTLEDRIKVLAVKVGALEAIES